MKTSLIKQTMQKVKCQDFSVIDQLILVA